MTSFSILNHGAAGDGQTLDTAAIQSAIDACAENGGGTVLLPAGKTYLAGSFELKSNIEFRVERGAVLKSATREEDFPLFAFTTGREAGKRLWIGGKHLQNVAITGGGVMLHAFTGAPFWIIAVLMTVGVYGLVACIVKLDDLGLWLSGRDSAVNDRFGDDITGLRPVASVPGAKGSPPRWER